MVDVHVLKVPEHGGESLFASGLLAAAEDRLEEAEASFSRAVEMYSRALSPSHPFVGEALIARGRIRRRTGSDKEGCADLIAGTAMLPPQDPRTRRAVSDTSGCG